MANQREKHNVEKYIQWVSTLSLTIWVYLHLFSKLPPKSAKAREAA